MHAYMHACIHTYMHTHRQTHRQTDTHTHTPVLMKGLSKTWPSKNRKIVSRDPPRCSGEPW